MQGLQIWFELDMAPRLSIRVVFQFFSLSRIEDCARAVNSVESRNALASSRIQSNTFTKEAIACRFQCSVYCVGGGQGYCKFSWSVSGTQECTWWGNSVNYFHKKRECTCLQHNSVNYFHRRDRLCVINWNRSKVKDQ